MDRDFVSAIKCIISQDKEDDAIRLLLNSMTEKARRQERLALERRACLVAIRKINRHKLKDDAIDALCDEENA